MALGSGSSRPRTLVLFAPLAFNQLKNGCTCTFVAPPQECPKTKKKTPNAHVQLSRGPPLPVENFNLKIIKTSHSRPACTLFVRPEA